MPGVSRGSITRWLGPLVRTALSFIQTLGFVLCTRSANHGRLQNTVLSVIIAIIYSNKIENTPLILKYYHLSRDLYGINIRSYNYLASINTVASEFEYIDLLTSVLLRNCGTDAIAFRASLPWYIREMKQKPGDTYIQRQAGRETNLLIWWGKYYVNFHDGKLGFIEL